jgi:cation:H+ antiporter
MHLIYLLWFVVSSLFLVKSADYLIKSLTKIAAYMKLSEFLLGFVIVAIATSLPELFVGITSALNGTPALSLGNVIGANILDITLVVGIAALLSRGIKVESKAIRSNTLYTFIITMMPLLLMADRIISRTDGVILLAIFALYIINLIQQEARFHGKIENGTRNEIIKSLAVALLSLALLMVSARFAVKYALLIAEGFGLPPILIGILLMSVGTTLPELTFETYAVVKNHGSMALGDLLGSVVVNTSLVLGIVALIHPIQADFTLFLTSCAFMVVIAFVFMTFVESEKFVSWQEGVALIFLYVLFIIVEINIHFIGAPHT